MTLLLILFLGAASLLWLSLYGYVLALGLLTLRRRQVERDMPNWPDIAIVVPTLNEENLILSKLADLQRTDYPRDRITIVVVDGGSVDQTTALVRQEIARGERIRLVCRDKARGQANDLKFTLELLTHEIVVVTDVDSVLEPACVRELVTTLEQSTDTVIVGAMVSPANGLPEEHMHRWFLNHLWWLEGEAVSSTGVSGACCAIRRKAVLPIYDDVNAYDINLALAAAAKGYRAHICRAARATETRPPQNRREFIRFRCRRGVGYVSELLRFWKSGSGPLSLRVLCGIRLFHLFVLPWVGAALIGSACIFMVTPLWTWPIIVLLAFATPVLAALVASTSLTGQMGGVWRLSLTAGRLFTLTLVSLLTLTFRSLTREALVSLATPLVKFRSRC